jgi:hypothetical protein
MNQPVANRDPYVSEKDENELIFAVAFLHMLDTLLKMCKFANNLMENEFLFAIEHKF